MSTTVYKIPLAQLTFEKPTTLWIDEKREVVVIPHEQHFEVYSSICPHMGAELVCVRKNSELFCPWHGLKFDLTDGGSNHPRYRHVKKYEAQIKDNFLEITL